MMIKKQNGASLIEAIVSLLVFSIGVLGITALQTLSLVRSGDVKQRSVAIWKAQELVDRIRSTRTIDNVNGLAGSYKTLIGGDVSEITSFTTRRNTVALPVLGLNVAMTFKAARQASAMRMRR